MTKWTSEQRDLIAECIISVYCRGAFRDLDPEADFLDQAQYKFALANADLIEEKAKELNATVARSLLTWDRKRPTFDITGDQAAEIESAPGVVGAFDSYNDQSVVITQDPKILEMVEALAGIGQDEEDGPVALLLEYEEPDRVTVTVLAVNDL